MYIYKYFINFIKSVGFAKTVDINSNNVWFLKTDIGRFFFKL